ncbi:hypothetical protein SDC9_141898 [bioreactor metagenome]|uniref:Uncharacterized protein n=1 Tax=bioreactor metagenome TaxID=1076179 RepID=A0A645DZ09_9ZZZZ
MLFPYAVSLPRTIDSPILRLVTPLGILSFIIKSNELEFPPDTISNFKPNSFSIFFDISTNLPVFIGDGIIAP